MANVTVQNSLTNTKAAKRTRYEKMESAYGKILAASYAVGDTLSFDFVPSLNIIHAKFVASDGTSLEMFYGANYNGPITFTIGSALDISYFINYIRGTGMVKDGIATAGEGERLQILTA